MTRVFSKSTQLKFATDLASSLLTGVIYTTTKMQMMPIMHSVKEYVNCLKNNFPLTKLSRAKLKDKKWITLGLRKSSRP